MPQKSLIAPAKANEMYQKQFYFLTNIEKLLCFNRLTKSGRHMGRVNQRTTVYRGFASRLLEYCTQLSAFAVGLESERSYRVIYMNNGICYTLR